MTFVLGIVNYRNSCQLREINMNLLYILSVRLGMAILYNDDCFVLFLHRFVVGENVSTYNPTYNALEFLVDLFL